MRVKTLKTKFNEVYLVPFSDLHVGDKGFTAESEKKLKGYIDWVKNTPNAFAILNGDELNCATRFSKSSPFEQTMPLNEQIEKVCELFKPIKHKLLGAITSNHHNRLVDFAGYDPTISICDRLGITYMGISGVYIIRMGCHGKNDSPRETFSIYSHHTVGGGRSVGSKINRVEMLRELVANCDIYCGSHNHSLSCAPVLTQVVNHTTEKVELIRQMLVDTGSYLQWGGYSENLMLQPVKLGSPKIHLSLKRKQVDGVETIEKDVHVSM